LVYTFCSVSKLSGLVSGGGHNLALDCILVACTHYRDMRCNRRGLFPVDTDHSRPRQVVGRLLPIAGLTLSVSLTLAISNQRSQAHKMTFIAKNEALLSGDVPKAVIYSEGMPDGGYAVVRSPDANPTKFSQSQMIALTGERIKSCERLSARDWFCHFD
jgi:hypothetical protein